MSFFPASQNFAAGQAEKGLREAYVLRAESDILSPLLMHDGHPLCSFTLAYTEAFHLCPHEAHTQCSILGDPQVTA